MSGSRFPMRFGAFLRRLARDGRGNALILSAALMMPLIALVGSGIDVGRIYLARSRMQQACDAASLAGRWAVSTGRDTSVVSSEANKFFNYNFPQGTYGTAAFTPTVSVTAGSTKVVTVSAATTMPMSIMAIFGARALPVTATCDARQDYVNTDIVLVLDTTGSMAEPANSSDSETKIVGLRKAVLALYDQLAPIQAQLEAAGMRLRYSVVPYSSTVNVGKLLRAVDPTWLNNPGRYILKYNGNYYYYDVNHDNNWFNNVWNGCIEERKTTSAITATTTTIPAEALDLNITLKPTDANSRWTPFDEVAQQAEYDRDDYHACPAGARRLQSWTRGNLSNYLDDLFPLGGTYHDIGMIWGARMISSGGVFADSPATYNGMPTNKFVIFMTDGQLSTYTDVYSAYGMENLEGRVTGGDFGTQNARHQQRFNLMCSAVKNAGASIWVVAFASTLDTSLTNCATNAGQASVSSNSAALIQKFAEIGKNIGALRLTQ